MSSPVKKPAPYVVTPRSETERPLPNAVKSERIVLGSIILDNKWIKAAIDTLRSSDFFLPEHQLIFTAMVELASQFEEIDTPKLFEHLSSEGKLEAAGGSGYLRQLADGLHKIPNIQPYIDRVKRKADLRQIAHVADGLYERALDPYVEPSELAAYTEAIAQILSPQARSEQSLNIPDMSESALDTRLGEICRRRLAAFPLSYAWIAMVTAAAALVPPSPNVRTNLFGAQVGPVGSGKSQAAERAFTVMGVVEPQLQRMMAGSAEGMVEKLGNSDGEPRLFWPDELGHLLTKAKIDNATFTFVLNSAYYRDSFDVTMARRKKVFFNCRLSILGGLVKDAFGDLFGSATTGGLYDRFIFGLCPQPFEYHYRPMEGAAEDTEPCSVTIHPDVWDARDEWVKTIAGLTARCAEHAIRVAVIAAAFSGRSILYARDLGPAREFAAYQNQIRKMLQPNPGENPDAKCAHAILVALGDSTEWWSVREIGKKIHSERFGPRVFRQTIHSLEGLGEISFDKKRPARLRRIGV